MKLEDVIAGAAWSAPEAETGAGTGAGPNLGSPVLDRYYRNDCVVLVAEGLRTATGGSELSALQIMRGCVLNFCAQRPGKRLLGLGELDVSDLLFTAYNAFGNVNILATPTELPAFRDAAAGAYGWNTLHVRVDGGAESLTRRFGIRFQFLVLSPPPDEAAAVELLRNGAPLLESKGHLVLAGATSGVDAILARLQPEHLQGAPLLSVSSPLGHGTFFRAALVRPKDHLANAIAT